MPLVEKDCILNESNRDFDSGVGDFSGELDWDPGPILGYTGLLKIHLEEYEDEKTISVHYPAFTVYPDNNHEFKFLTITESIEDYFEWTIGITDGNYIEENVQRFGSYHQQVQWLGWNGLLEADWFKESTEISITIKSLKNEPLDFYIDASIMRAWVWEEEPPPSKIDYLPIMGVG